MTNQNKTFEAGIQHSAEWIHIYETRVAMFCGGGEPTPEQRQIATDEADRAIESQCDDPDLDPVAMAALERIRVKARERRAEHVGKNPDKYRKPSRMPHNND